MANEAVDGGESTQGTAVLTAPAPEGGVVVALASSTASVTVPASVTIDAGATSATFSVTTTTVPMPVVATITGSVGAVTRTVTLQLHVLVALAQLGIAVSDVTGGHETTGSVTLTAPAKESGFVVALSSNHPGVSVPPSLTVASGSSAATFPVVTEKVLADMSATITAAAEGVQRTAPLKVSRGTFLSFVSDPGDYIVQGGSIDYALEGNFFQASVDTSLNTVSITARALNHSWWWYLYLAAPQGAQLRPGVYEDARRWPFQPSTQPGLSFSGDGRGCNTLTGRFVVEDVVYGVGPIVERLDATFVQHCEGASPALRGRIRIRADPWR